MIDMKKYTLADVYNICKCQIDTCKHCRFYDEKGLECTFLTKEPADWPYCIDSSANDVLPEVPPVETTNDTVNHPSHYTCGKIEVINYIKDKLRSDEYLGYCTGNVLKYVSRWRHKGGTEDLKKAMVYLKWAIEAAEE